MDDFARPLDLKGDRAVYGTDDGFIVEFYIKPLLQEAKSKEAAYPVYEDRVFIKLVSPGNTKTVWDYQAKGVRYNYDDDGSLVGFEADDMYEGESDTVRFSKSWEKFIKKGTKAKQGWDIAEWGAIPRSFAETLKALNIPTVEALASLSDSNADTFMGGRKFRDLAKAALSEAATLELASKEQERANKAEEENKQMRSDIAALKQELASLKSRKAAA